jgi:hypothetical protein
VRRRRGREEEGLDERPLLVVNPMDPRAASSGRRQWTTQPGPALDRRSGEGCPPPAPGGRRHLRRCAPRPELPRHR